MPGTVTAAQFFGSEGWFEREARSDLNSAFEHVVSKLSLSEVYAPGELEKILQVLAERYPVEFPLWVQRYADGVHLLREKDPYGVEGSIPNPFFRFIER